MVVFSVRYEFSQHFRVPPRQAFDWCTDYTPEDHALMGHKGRRQSRRVTDDTIILVDTSYPKGRAVTRRKLIRLDPERLTYYNIHLTGPNEDSLYFYRIVPDGEGESRLDYTGYEVSYPKRTPTKQQQAEMAEAETASWRKEWGNLAAAMEAELRKP